VRLAIICLLTSVAFPFAIRTENPADVPVFKIVAQQSSVTFFVKHRWHWKAPSTNGMLP
jgi:hypothetical protein